MTHIQRIVASIIIATAAVWLAGFYLFVSGIEELHAPSLTPDLEITDAIVVPTGGSERVTMGIELLESGRAKKLFISGVHKGLRLDEVLGAQPVPADLRTCCIALGHQAGSTIGNAEETQRWMNEQGYQSLRLVTANYHMPRSLMLFHAAMPDVKIIPHPVTPDSVKLYHWWIHPGTIDLLATEYGKFIVANIRLTFNRSTLLSSSP
jgi:uncharacterized SAM-binding protein YcdF (DUF218 family)